MNGFRTKNSVYYVDAATKRITGGYFGDAWMPYTHLQAIQGCKAVIKLFDGRIVTTGIVLGYI